MWVATAEEEGMRMRRWTICVLAMVLGGMMIGCCASEKVIFQHPRSLGDLASDCKSPDDVSGYLIEQGIATYIEGQNTIPGSKAAARNNVYFQFAQYLQSELEGMILNAGREVFAPREMEGFGDYVHASLEQIARTTVQAQARFEVYKEYTKDDNYYAEAIMCKNVAKELQKENARQVHEQLKDEYGVWKDDMEDKLNDAIDKKYGGK